MKMGPSKPHRIAIGAPAKAEQNFHLLFKQESRRIPELLISFFTCFLVNAHTEIMLVLAENPDVHTATSSYLDGRKHSQSVLFHPDPHSF